MKSVDCTETPAVETADHAGNRVELVLENGRIALEISTPQGILRYELSEKATSRAGLPDSSLSSGVWQVLERLRSSLPAPEC